MKYCEKCGSNISDGTEFCPQCGAKQAAHPAGLRFCPSCGGELEQGSARCSKCGFDTRRVSTKKSTLPLQPAMMPKVIMGNLKKIDNTKYFYLTSLVSLILLAILPIFPIFSFSSFLGSQDGYIFGGNAMMTFCSFALFLGSAFMACTALYTDSVYLPNRMIMGMVVKILFLLLFWLLTSVSNDVSSSSFGLVESSLNFNGWLILLAGIAGLVADIKTMIDLRKINNFGYAK